ncbi:MAG: exosortase/archaeosortase family protein [Arenicella sp.]|jgi:exosortase/archaeosortase family protein
MQDNYAALPRVKNYLMNLRHQQQFALPLFALLITYFLLRVLFKQYIEAKTWFIYPSGVVVNWFKGSGEYLNYEWVFGIQSTRFVLGEPCSGTTFFSLLIAYIVYRILTHRASLMWLLLAYPIAIAANSMRVLSSISAHNSLAYLNALKFTSEVHVITGTIAFSVSFLLVAYLIERPTDGVLK